MNVLFTGTANLHGLPIVQIMLKRGDAADAIENLNDGFDAKFKPTRLKQLKQLKSYLNFKFVCGDIGGCVNVDDLFAAKNRAGSSIFPDNLIGSVNLLEGSRYHQAKKQVRNNLGVYGCAGGMRCKATNTLHGHSLQGFVNAGAHLSVQPEMSKLFRTRS